MSNTCQANGNALQQSDRAKRNILNKLKAEVANADYSKLPVEPHYQYPKLSHEQQVVQFIAHLAANHAQVIKIDAAELSQVVNEQLKQRNITSLLSGNNSPLSLQASEFDSNIELKTYDFLLADKKNCLFNDTPASITSSHAAIAATGSIVLWPTIAEPRTLSLVPPVHFVVVDATTISCDFASLIKTQKWQDKLPTNIVLVSGPSKTADIQQTLAYGAHGPKELIVLLVNHPKDI